MLRQERYRSAEFNFAKRMENWHLQYLAVTSIVVGITFVVYRVRNWAFFANIALRALRKGGPIPSHVAFIMDGNRRWARKGGLPAHEGHPYGGEKLIESLQWCLEAGVETVTVYAFSIENFKRSRREVNEIMELAIRKFYTLADRAEVIHSNRIRVRVLGDLALIPSDLRAIMARVMADTAHYAGGPTLNICFAYTARHDIASAVHQLAVLCRDGDIDSGQISETTISACLSTGYAKGADLHMQYPQLLVRTSGETRLSDFLLWEASDAVLSFYPVLWPDLTSWDFVNILLDYQEQYAARTRGRVRRGRESELSGCELWTREQSNKVTAEKSILGAMDRLRSRYFDEVAAFCNKHECSRTG